MTAPLAGVTSLEKLLAGSQLAALPQSAVRVLEITRNPQNGPTELAAAIEADPGLATQVLKYVNSSYFGFAREISSVKSAITLVSMRSIKNFVLWNAIYSLVPNPRCGPFDLKSLWQDCVRRGLFARLAGRDLGLADAEDLFVAGLLQDMAIPVLAKLLPADYGQLLERRSSEKVRLSQLERELFGWTHSEAASALAAMWNFPPSITSLLGEHVNIATLADRNVEPDGLLIVALSSLLPATSDDDWPEAAVFERQFRQVFPADVGLVEMLAQVDADFAEFAPVLKLAGDVTSLVDRYQQATAVCS